MADAIQPSNSTVRPLVISTEPFPGEYLMSLLVRASEANVFTKPVNMLNVIGIGDQATQFVPFSRTDHASDIAMLLGTSVEAVESRMHPSAEGDPRLPAVGWFGSTIERRDVLENTRRFAPRSLEQHQHYPALWALRVLDFCPTTMEMLISNCPQCARPLGWRACKAVSKCDKCGASLFGATSSMLPSHLHEDARLGAALVNPEDAIRQAAVSALPEPFNTWTPSEALSGLVTLGEAQCWLQSADVETEDVGGAAVMAAGIAFARGWPDSLAEFARASTIRTASHSVRLGLGPLGKLFGRGVARTSPIANLVRSTISSSLGKAVVPAKLVPGIVDDSCRVGMLTTAQASERLGVSLDLPRRLEGRSDTFITRHNVKGGPALYDEAAIDQLAKVLSESLRPADCARRLGIPAYCIPAFVAAGLLDAVTCSDALIVTGCDLIAKPSCDSLRKRLQSETTKVEAGIPLRQAMRNVGAPGDWVDVFQKILSRDIRIQFIDVERSALTDALLVSPLEIKRYVRLRAADDGTAGIVISCIAAARLIGTTPQTVSAAVRAGLIAGQARGKNYALPLEVVLSFQKDFVLTEELCELLDQTRWRMGDLLRRAGYQPFAVINRARIWRRSDVERYVQKRAELDRPPSRLV